VTFTSCPGAAVTGEKANPEIVNVAAPPESLALVLVVCEGLGVDSVGVVVDEGELEQAASSTPVATMTRALRAAEEWTGLTI
jgi:hypothetical protein